MATVAITIGGVDTRTGAGVPYAVPDSAEALTSSGTSQTASISGDRGSYFSITSSGGAIWATFGTSPTAAAGTTHLIPDGGTAYFFNANTDGLQVAIIDA